MEGDNKRAVDLLERLRSVAGGPSWCSLPMLSDLDGVVAHTPGFAAAHFALTDAGYYGASTYAERVDLIDAAIAMLKRAA